jgi:hypothetical protein
LVDQFKFQSGEEALCHRIVRIRKEFLS